MSGQLELTATEVAEDETGAEAIRVGVPNHILKLVGRLEPSARAELDQRLAVAVQQSYTAIAEIRSLTPDQLLVSLAIARRDVERLEEEMERRAGAAPGPT